jgi:transcriptional regulator with XRE-family HTH domain
VIYFKLNPEYRILYDRKGDENMAKAKKNLEYARNLADRLSLLRSQTNSSSRVRSLRTHKEGIPKRISLKEVSEKVGIPASTLSEYENGRAIPGLENAVKLSDFYRVSLDYLAARTEEGQKNKIKNALYRKRVIETGLSEGAINRLLGADADTLNFVSSLLESPHLQGLIHDLIQNGGEYENDES